MTTRIVIGNLLLPLRMLLFQQGIFFMYHRIYRIAFVKPVVEHWLGRYSWMGPPWWIYRVNTEGDDFFICLQLIVTGWTVWAWSRLSRTCTATSRTETSSFSSWTSSSRAQWTGRGLYRSSASWKSTSRNWVSTVTVLIFINTQIWNVFIIINT